MNKHIEEMAKALCGLDRECEHCTASMSYICKAKKYAERAYTAGYRKQSEIIDEFAKRLLDAFPEAHRGGNLCPSLYYDDYRYIIEELVEEMKGGAA